MRTLGARRCVEVGTFTGFSALCVARALPDDGTLLCCDVSEEWTAIGREHWQRAGVEQPNYIAYIDDNTVAIRQTNDYVASHPDLESVILPVADGLTFARKR